MPTTMLDRGVRVTRSRWSRPGRALVVAVLLWLLGPATLSLGGRRLSAVTLCTFGENGAEAELVLGLPGEVIQLEVASDDHRILREQFTAPNHLITRAFVYPTS